MIVREFYKTRDDGARLYITYSDVGKKIQKVGTEEIYDEAVDVEEAGFEYAETGEDIDDDVDDSTALRALLGGEGSETE